MPLRSDYRAYDFVNKRQMEIPLLRKRAIPRSKGINEKHHHEQSQNNERCKILYPSTNKTGSNELHKIHQNPNYNNNHNDFHVQPYRNPQYGCQPNAQQQYYGQQQQQCPPNPNNCLVGPPYPQCGDNRCVQRPVSYGYNNYPHQQNNCENCWSPNNNAYPQRGNMPYAQYNRPETVPEQSRMKYFGNNEYNQQKECNVLNLDSQKRNEWFAMNPQGILKIDQPNQPQEFTLSRNFSTSQKTNMKEITINSNCLKETKEPQEILIKDQHGVPQGILKYNRRVAKKTPQSNDPVQQETKEANNDEPKTEKANACTNTDENPENVDDKPSKKSNCSWRLQRLSRPKTSIY